MTIDQRTQVQQQKQTQYKNLLNDPFVWWGRRTEIYTAVRRVR